MNKKVISGIMLASALVLAATGSARAEKLKLGMLTCDISKGIGLIVTEKQKLDCVYDPEGDGPTESYKGSIHEYGLAIGGTTGGEMSWVVLSAQSGVPQGALAGTYGGASANASAGIGGGANYLVGGSGQSFSLQPYSLQGQTGVNASAGVTRMELHSAD